MWWNYCIFSLLAIITVVNSDDTCNEPIAIYKDLRCTPIYAQSGDKCPMKFDCSNVQQRPKGKCTYRGKSYAINEEIPKEETYANCQIGCYCRSTDQITCAILDCPEWMGMRPRAGSHFAYTLNECCSIGEKSAPYGTCEVGAEVYKEGERFSAPQRCTECVCAEGWRGKFERPFCAPKTCTEEMHNMHKITANCAPSYLGVNSCCPFRWICPDDDKANDIISLAPPTMAVNSPKCKYGSKLLNIGDKFQRDEPISSYERFEIKCECKIPPFLTCTQKQVFDKDNTPQHIKDALGLKD